jgi:hypothetical protein
VFCKPEQSWEEHEKLIANAEEFHTFDVDLLSLDGKLDKLDGTRLLIKKPAVPAPPAPLLEEIERGRGND